MHSYHVYKKYTLSDFSAEILESFLLHKTAFSAGALVFRMGVRPRFSQASGPFLVFSVSSMTNVSPYSRQYYSNG